MMPEARRLDDLENRLKAAPVVPLIQASDPAQAVATAESLVPGGLTVVEVVLRTDEAIACLRAVAEDVPAAIVGAGTVLCTDQASAAIDAGAAFIVSPGLDERVARLAQERKLPVFRASQLRRNCKGVESRARGVKFFPAAQAGGTAMIKALGSVFRNIRFMPTGGISAANLAEYLALPSVLACGGSWLTPAAAINAGDYAAITRLAREAIAISAKARNH